MTGNPAAKSPGRARGNRAPILIVEENAHRTEGHYAELFAELALAVRGLGRPVAVLTSRRWALAEDPEFRGLTTFEFGPVASRVLSSTEVISRRASHRGVRLLGSGPRSLAVIAAARWRRQRSGASTVIALGRGIHPLLGSLLVDAGNWLLYRFDGPSPWLEGTDARRGIAGVARALGRRSVLTLSRRMVERRHERRKGSVRLVVNNDNVRDRWQRIAPWLNPASVPFAMSRARADIPMARQQLGLAARDRIALSFGTPHGGKDLDTVWRAFARLPEWQLVIAGNGAADAYRAWSATNGPVEREPRLIDGYVDRRTRDLLYSAADVSIMSFRPGTTHDSATLTDSLSSGVVVVCSDGCPAADLVREYRLGTLFAPADPASLVKSVRQAPRAIDADALHAAREQLSAEATAAKVLALVGA